MQSDELEPLAKLIYKVWQLLTSMNILPNSELGMGVFVHLIKHAFGKDALSMKDLNADVPAAISGIRRMVSDLENNAWVIRENSPDDERVVIVTPAPKLIQRATTVLEEASAELDIYFHHRESQKSLRRMCNTSTVPVNHPDFRGQHGGLLSSPKQSGVSG